jgi:hypothetical protein
MREPEFLNDFQQQLYDQADAFIEQHAVRKADINYPIVTIQQLKSFIMLKTRDVIQGRIPTEMLQFLATDALLQGIIGKRDISDAPKVVFNLNTEPFPFYANLGRSDTAFACMFELPSEDVTEATVEGCSPYVLLCGAENFIRRKLLNHAISNV